MHTSTSCAFPKWLGHSVQCSVAIAVTWSWQNGKAMLSLPSAVTSLHVGSCYFRGCCPQPLQHTSEKLEEAATGIKTWSWLSWFSPWFTTSKRGHSLGLDRTTGSAAVSVALAQRVSSSCRDASWDGQVGLSLVSGPPLCHKDSTAAPSHRWSLLLPLQVSAKKRQRGEGAATPRLKLLLRENLVTPLSTLTHSASGNVSNLSVFLMTGVVKVSYLEHHFPFFIPGAAGTGLSVFTVHEGAAAGSCLSPAFLFLSIGSEALHLLQPQTNQVTNASRFWVIKKTATSVKHSQSANHVCAVHLLRL